MSTQSLLEYAFCKMHALGTPWAFKWVLGFLSQTTPSSLSGLSRSFTRDLSTHHSSIWLLWALGFTGWDQAIPFPGCHQLFFTFSSHLQMFPHLGQVVFSLCLRLNLSSFLSRVTRLSLRYNFSFSFSSLEMVALSSSVSRIGTCVGSGIGVE